MTRDSKSHLCPPIEAEIEALNALASRSEPPAGPISAAGPSGEPLILDTLTTDHALIEAEIEALNVLSSCSELPEGFIGSIGPSGETPILHSLTSSKAWCNVLPISQEQHWPKAQGLWLQSIQNPPPPKSIIDVVEVWWPKKLEI